MQSPKPTLSGMGVRNAQGPAANFCRVGLPLIDRMLDAGVEHARNAEEHYLTRLINIIAYANGIMAAVGTVLVAMLGHYELAFAVGSVPVLMGIGLLFSATGMGAVARGWVCATPVLASFFMATVTGTEMWHSLPILFAVLAYSAFAADERTGTRIAVLTTSMSAVVIYTPWILPNRSGEFPDTEYDVVSAVMHVLILLACMMMLAMAKSVRDAIVREAEAHRAAAEEAGQSRTMFLSNMSHEFRTPLSIILGHVAALKESGATSKAGDPIQAIDTQGHKLLGLVNNVLDFSKLDAGQLLIDAQPTAPRRVIEAVAARHRPAAEAKGVGLSISYGSPMPKSVHTDEQRLYQILSLLLENAIKFTLKGNIRLIARIDELALKLTVADTGVGLEASEIDRVLQPFHQRDEASSRRFGGAGLGLALAHGLAGALDGALSIESEVGVGTQVTVVLRISPLESRDVETSTPPVARPSDEARWARLDGLKLLLAEDFVDAANLISLRLRQQGAAVDWVADGKAALDALHSDDAPYDVAVLDGQMPLMGGVEVLRELRTAGNTLPCLMLTANATETDRQTAIAAGADGYLTKPVDFGALMKAIQRLTPMSEAHGHAKTSAHPAANEAAASTPDPTAKLDAALTEWTAQFAASLPKRVQDMRAAFEAGDLEALQGLAHKIKGTAGMYGFNVLGEAAAAISDPIKTDTYNIEAVGDDLIQFERAAAKITEPKKAA